MRRASTLVVLAALVAAGCGGDDDETTTAAAISKAELIKQGDALCRKGDQEINQAAGEVFGQGQQPSKAEQEQFATDTVAPSIQKQVDGIRALGAPEGDEEQVTAILDSAQDGVDQIKDDPAALTEGGGNPLGEASKLAREYGFKVCGQG